MIARDTGTVAVIGSGVAGLTAAYLLRRRYDVVLFEADNRLGGHAHTHDLASPAGGTVAVDSGFIVHNRRTYPNLIRLFDELGVDTQPTEMSMSVRCDGCGLEYAGGRRLPGLVPRPGVLTRPAYLRMLTEVPRFHRAARKLLAADGSDDLTLGEFLRAGRFSRYFADHFALPVVSAVWSADARTSARYPARYLFAFLDHHGMLAVTGSPLWRTVVGGSREYVRRAAKGVAVHTSTPVRAVHRHADGVRIRDDADHVTEVGQVVVATHPDQALRLLADPTAGERAILGAFRYSRNETWLHTDPSPLPRAAGAAASWNYRKPTCASGPESVLVTYNLNRLMRLPGPQRHLVTLNAAGRVAPDRVLRRMVYEHPIYTPESVVAQRRLPDLNTGRTAFAGAYHGWGFHEDGCAAGVRAAVAFGAGW